MTRDAYDALVLLIDSAIKGNRFFKRMFEESKGSPNGAHEYEIIAGTLEWCLDKIMNAWGEDSGQKEEGTYEQAYNNAISRIEGLEKMYKGLGGEHCPANYNRRVNAVADAYEHAKAILRTELTSAHKKQEDIEGNVE